MIDERQVIDILRDDSFATQPGLLPDRVIEGARRRRTRHRVASGLAAAAVAGVAAVGVVAANGIGPAVDAPAAGSGSPTTASVTPSGKTTSRQTPSAKPEWRPGGAVGALPIGRIPRSGKVEIAEGRWFETVGTQWCITASDPDSPSGTIQPFGCRGTVGNTNLSPGLSGMQISGRYVSSVFDGNLRRVLYAAGDRYYEARLYRLDGVPGWMVAAASLPTGKSADAVFGYDAKGRLVAQFPGPRDGGPRTDPLHPR